MTTVSIIVPCYNEEATIFLLLEAVYEQTFPRAEMEVIIADGLSTDRTRQEIARFQRQFPDLTVQLVDNPKRHIPAALNRAIQAASGEYLIRLDAHCKPYPNYIDLCLRELRRGRGDNVGGIWEIRPWSREGTPASWIASGIAVAAAHPLGVGDALYRYTTRSQPVDTVPFGAFRRELVNRMGGYNESLLTNEDYEFNQRLRQAGGTIWLNPEIRSIYFARPTIWALIRQYWRYGYWKGRMLCQHPQSLRWRQALPPAFVLSLLILLVLSLFGWLPRWLLMFQVSLYLLALAAVGLQTALQRKEIAYLVSLPLAIASMHLAWGAGVNFSLAQAVLEKLIKRKTT